jgi:hypothetical protein
VEVMTIIIIMIANKGASLIIVIVAQTFNIMITGLPGLINFRV